MKRASSVLFYTIDKAIRSYRQFAENEIKNVGLHISIDEWLVLNALVENPKIDEARIGELVFKDEIFVAQIIETLVKNKYLKEEVSLSDKKEAHYKVTIKGINIIRKLNRVVLKYRATALEGISKKDQDVARETLLKIIDNCSK